MLTHLRQLKEQIPLETAYKWPIPPGCPIEIPEHIIGGYERNVYLKEHLAPALERDINLEHHYWVIRKWGGIRGFKKENDEGKIGRNDERIRTFKAEVFGNKQLTKDSFKTISSFSKLSSFWDWQLYAIYDSRAVFSLNWVIFRQCKKGLLFPQPQGRNTALASCDTKTLFEGRKYYAPETAYHKYCSLLRKLSKKVYCDARPFKLEMLLFLAAPGQIAEEIQQYRNRK